MSLEIKNLSVQIEKKEILKDLNLNIKEGEIHVLMGINGAGKSSLAKTLVGHYDCEVTKGSIKFKNKDLLKMNVEERANEGLFLSFQNPVEIAGVSNSYFLKAALNAKRVYENKEELDALSFLKEIKSKIKKYNIDDKLIKRNLNEGFSGGEKKRNELIQLLLLNPELIILDEIDSGLDIDAIKIVANVVNDMMKDKKKSLLMITHYDRLLELIKPDFVHIMKDGKIIKTGDYSLALEIQKNGFKEFGFENNA